MTNARSDESVGTNPIRMCQAMHLNLLSKAVIIKAPSVARGIHLSGRGSLLRQ